MCERFAQVLGEELTSHVGRWVGDLDGRLANDAPREPGKDFNVGPSDLVLVVVGGRDRSAATWMRWGLPPEGSVLNVDLREALPPSSRLLERRTAVPMTGFYEWDRHTGQPHFFQWHDGSPIMVAAVHRADAGAEGLGLLVGPAPPDVADVRGRLPLVVEPDHVDAWLDPRVAPDAAARLVDTPREGTLVHFPVTRRVHGIEARGSELIQPIHVPSP